MKIEITSSTSDEVRFRVNNRSLFSANITDYQDHRSVTADDITIGDNTVCIRLGRDNDMFMIAAFHEQGNSVCCKFLFVQLRDGDNIRVEYQGHVGGRELYGFVYGRLSDLYNEYGIRDADYSFIFDPRAPRTGRDRNANTVIVSGHPPGHYVVDQGCR